MKLITTECMIIQYLGNQNVIRIPFASTGQKWNVIEKNGYIIIGSNTIKTNDLERMSLSEPRTNNPESIKSIK